MRTPAQPRVLLASLLLILASVVGVFAFGPNARSEDASDARAVPNFSRLQVLPANLAFKALNFNKSGQTPETKTFVIKNNGRGTTPMTAQLGPVLGTGATAFQTNPAGPVLIGPLLPGAEATVSVTFEPVVDGRATATILITSDGVQGVTSRGPVSHTLRLAGSARGPIPTPSATPTQTATPTPTPPVTTPTPTPTAPVTTATPTPTPTAVSSPTETPSITPTPTPTPTASTTTTTTPTPTVTSTPIAQGAGTTSKNSANAPGIIITGNTVTAYIPLATDSFAAAGLGQAVIENDANPLPGAGTYTANRVNSCTPASSGEVVCSEGNALSGASFDLIPAGASTTAVTTIPSSSTGVIDYLPGECSGCGVLVDDTLGTGGAGLGILSASAGFFTLDLGNIANTPLGPIATNPSEPPGANFGYDAAHHRVLNANYQLTSLPPSLVSTAPQFQIIDITNSASPLVYDLNNAVTFFEPGTQGTQCNGANNDNQFPETTAIDEGTNIAYVSFHTPPNCENTPPNTVALFDLSPSQATFTPGVGNASGTWDTTGKQIQMLTDFSVNGVDPISIEPTNHVAIVSGGSTPFGALQLPTTSGSGTPAISDWVSANMPNDPEGTPWNGWSLPNGVATYVSPNTGKPIGLMLNSLEDGLGNRTGLARYAALVDIKALLALPRDQVGGHQVLGTSDGQALVTGSVVTFVLVR